MKQFLAVLLLALAPAVRAADPPAKIYVILWFDTEDYILPASDDAACTWRYFRRGRFSLRWCSVLAHVVAPRGLE